MARFRVNRKISVRWNGLIFEGPALTVFEVPDEYNDELQSAMLVEPTFEWVDQDEGNTLRARVTTLESAGAGAALSNSNPVALGTAAPGTGVSSSRTDHIHPTTGISLSAHTHAAYLENSGDTLTGTLTVSNTGSLVLFGATSTANVQVSTRVDGEANTRWGIRADGLQAWGDGTVSRDTNLYRYAANTLATDDNFYVAQSLTVDGDIIHPAQLDISAGGGVAASITSSGLHLPAAKRIAFEGATDDGFETVLTVADPTADRTVTIPNATGTVALTADKLSAFAATTSAELAGVISNETGTGSLVFGTSPTLDGVTLTATASTPVIHGIVLPATHGISFEGATDDAFETILTAGDPTADRTITLPNNTGTLAIGQNVETTSDVTFNDVTLAARLKHATQLTFSVAATDAASVVSTGFYMPPGKTIRFEGTTDNGFETDLTIIDATADNTISLPNQSGTVALTSHTHTDIAAAGWEAFTFGSSSIVATHPRFVLSVTGGLSSGIVYHTKLIPHKDFTLSNISFTGVAAASVPTLIRFGIYTRSGTTFTLVARTASDTSIFAAANTKYTRALSTTGGYPATYTLTAGTEYWVSNIQVATTAATVLAATARTTSAANSATGGQLYQESSQTELPTSSTGVLQTGGGGLYAEVS